jgi:hypothetical protein
MRPTFSSTQYEFAHGKKPRGFGAWAFFFDRNADDVENAKFFTGSFGDAKKQAMDFARANGKNSVEVGS